MTLDDERDVSIAQESFITTIYIVKKPGRLVLHWVNDFNFKRLQLH